MNAGDEQDLFRVAAIEPVRHDRIVRLLYAAVMDDRNWVEVLQELRSLFAANFLSLILREASADDPGLVVWVGEDERGEDVRFSPCRPFPSPFVNLLADQVHTVEDLMSISEWRGSTYYKLWCMPIDVFHVMTLDISISSAVRLPLRITRREAMPAFSLQDRARCRVLLPHLRQALQMSNELQRQESLGGLYSSAIGRLAVGAIVLDASGRVLEQNLMANEILASGDGLKLVGGRLEAFYPADNRALHDLIRAAFALQRSGKPAVLDALAVARPSGRLGLGVVVDVLPQGQLVADGSQPVAVLYVRDPESPMLGAADVIKQLFNLTPSETAVALKLADGASLDKVAEDLDIRRNTARAHLRSIFSKTGVRRQTELVRVLLNSVAALRASV